MGDVVQMCGYDEENSKTCFIGKVVIKNVGGGTLLVTLDGGKAI